MGANSVHQRRFFVRARLGQHGTSQALPTRDRLPLPLVLLDRQGDQTTPPSTTAPSFASTSMMMRTCVDTDSDPHLRVHVNQHGDCLAGGDREQGPCPEPAGNSARAAWTPPRAVIENETAFCPPYRPRD